VGKICFNSPDQKGGEKSQFRKRGGRFPKKKKKKKKANEERRGSPGSNSLRKYHIPEENVHKGPGGE